MRLAAEAAHAPLIAAADAAQAASQMASQVARPLDGQVATEACYPRRPPAFANVELLEAADLQALASRWTAAEQMAPPIRLHDLGAAQIAFPGIVRLPDGGIIAESLHNLQPGRHAAVVATAFQRGVLDQAGAEPTLLLARAGSANYGHWLVEHLGALLLLRQAMPDLRPRLAVNDRGGEPMLRVFEAGTRMAGLDPAGLLRLGRNPLGVERLLMLSPASLHPYMKHPAAVEALARLAPLRAATDLLFIRRTSTSKRVLRNRDVVEAAALRLGFRIIEPGRMTFAEQIEAFAGARVVAGVSGADLTNIVFMPEGGELVCLLPASGRNLFFWDLCCIRRHRYWSVFGRTLTARGGGHDDFEVDAALAGAVMDQAVNAR